MNTRNTLEQLVSTHKCFYDENGKEISELKCLLEQILVLHDQNKIDINQHQNYLPIKVDVDNENDDDAKLPHSNPTSIKSASFSDVDGIQRIPTEEYTFSKGIRNQKTRFVLFAYKRYCAVSPYVLFCFVCHQQFMYTHDPQHVHLGSCMLSTFDK